MFKGKKSLLALVVIVCLASTMMLAGCSSGEKTDQKAEAPAASTENKETPAAEKEEPAEWEVFLNEYEAWTDSYIAFVDKYLENPSDPSLLSDYTQMSTDMNKWSSRATEIQQSLSQEEAQKYLDRANEITERLTEAAQKLIDSAKAAA